MKYFNPIEREYVAPIDLNVATNSLQTLEKGHQEAVKAASDLEIAIANLPMNEKEALYKQGILNSIKTTVRDNTLYGNSYGALDNLVAQQGDIMSNGGVIGRIANQKAYLDYMKQIDAAAIPEDYKEYYRKKNEYYYKDKFDKDGNELQGDSWEPQKRFVNSIDTFKVMNQAIANAAKKKGGSDVTNDNGVIKTRVGNQWEILDKDTIITAVKNAFKNTPGMDASLDQDYEILLDKYTTGKYVEGNPAYDNKGNMRTREMYVNNLIDEFAGFTAYNHNYHTSEYIQHAPPETTRSSGDGSGLSDDIINDAANEALKGATQIGTTDIVTNAYDTSMANLKGAKGVIDGIFGKVGIKNAADIGAIMNFAKANGGKNITGPQSALNYILGLNSRLKDSNGKTYGELLSPKDKASLRLAYNTLYEEGNNLNNMHKAAGDDGEAFKFMNSVNNGSYDANNSSYDKQIVNKLNTLFGPKFEFNKPNTYSDSSLTIEIPKDMYDKFTKLYGGNLPNCISTTKSNDNYVITIDNKDRNILPELSFKLQQANDETRSWWNPFNLVHGLFNKGHKSEGYKVHNARYSKNQNKTLNMYFRELADIYNQGVKKGKEVTNNYTTKLPTNGRISQEATNHSTATSATNEVLRKSGYIKSEEELRLNKMAEDRVDAALANAALSAGLMFEVNNKDDEKSINYTPTENQFELQTLISKMYANKKAVTRQWGRMKSILDAKTPGLHSRDGYYLTFTVPEEYASKHYKAGRQMKIFVAGTIDEGTGYNISGTTIDLAENAANSMEFSGGPVSIIPHNKHFNDSSVKRTDAGYVVNFMGKKSIITDKETLIDYNNALYTLGQCKLLLGQKPNSNNANAMNAYNERLKSIMLNLQSVAIEIGQINNIDPTTVYNNIYNYLQDGTIQEQ